MEKETLRLSAKQDAEKTEILAEVRPLMTFLLMMLEIFTPEKYSPLSTKQDAEKNEILA